MENFRDPSSYIYPNDMYELIKTLTNIIENKKKVDTNKKKIWSIINNIYDQWAKLAEKENDENNYYKLISFLTLALSTNCFKEEQEELEYIINEIYYSDTGLTQSFNEEEVKRAIENSLGAEIKKCIINKNNLMVEFIKGDYGEGIFDGKFVIDKYDGIFLHTDKEVLQYTGKLPLDSYEIELVINSSYWKKYEEKKG